MPPLPRSVIALICSLQFTQVAEADVLAGKAAFERQCASCHELRAPDGTILAGRRARTGPNLYAIVGAQAAAVDGFRYGSALTAAGAAGLSWTREALLGYLADPTAFLRTVTEDPKARSRMAWKVRDPVEAANIHAFLASLD